MSKPLLIIHCAAAVLLAYIGTYLVLMKPVMGVSIGLGGSILSPQPWVKSPAYKIDCPLVESAFEPLAWLDRKIRPSYWSNYRVYFYTIDPDIIDKANN